MSNVAAMVARKKCSNFRLLMDTDCDVLVPHGPGGLIDHSRQQASVVCVRWGSCMALSDHVRNRTKDFGPQRRARGFAQADRPPFRFSNDNHPCLDDDGPAEELD